MGGATRFLIPGADPEKIAGIVLNPMQQSEPSKHGILANADNMHGIFGKVKVIMKKYGMILSIIWTMEQL